MAVIARARDAETRRARGEQILDAAAELLLRWGYSRVTMDDVAEATGLGKGTIYLHWKTREQLFATVLWREFAEAIAELVEALRADPHEAVVHRLMRRYFLAIMRRPVARAAVLTDPELLGKMSKQTAPAFRACQAGAIEQYLRLHMEHGVLGKGMTAEEAIFAVRATVRGFFLADVIDGEIQPLTLERKADLLGTTLQQAFELVEPLNEQALYVISSAAIALFDGLSRDVRIELERGWA